MRVALLFVSGSMLAAALLPLKYTALLGSGASITAVAVDASGSAYVTGSANSSALPATPGAFQTTYRPAECSRWYRSFPCPVAFAAKLSPDGKTLVYLTYLGTAMSQGTGISVDSQGNAWITGWAGGTDLPVTPGAFQSAPKTTSSSNGFVLKLNAAASRVLYASYFGGSSDADLRRAQAVDSGGNLYVAGYTESSDFPVTSGALQMDPGPAPLKSGFLSKFDASGRLVYSTYVRGSTGSTYLTSIAADAAGSVYATGYHTDGSLPVTEGAFQTSAAVSAGPDAFALKLDSSGSKLVYCTYLAANSPDRGTAIAVDRQGNAYVAGNIQPTTWGLPSALPDIPYSFPVTPGAFQATPPPPTSWGGQSSGFAAKLDPAGSSLVWATYLGASDTTSITSMAVDGDGSAIAFGSTVALDFPATAGALFQCNPSGSSSFAQLPSFLTKLAADGSRPVYSTYLPYSSAVAVGAGGVVYAAGGLGGLPVVPGSFGWTGPRDGTAVIALAPEPLPPGSIRCVVSAASRGGTAGALGAPAIAPGEIVDILGNGIGPAENVSASVESGQLPVSLGGVQVLFDGYAAPLLSAGPDQIRAIVPFEILPPIPGEKKTTDVRILNKVSTTPPFAVTAASLVPSVFTLDGRPEGQALMLNEDGTLNSVENPAPRGSIVTIYATGLNQTNPPLATGSIATDAAALEISGLTILGLPPDGILKPLYAGAAPGLAAGVTQINFRVPTDGMRAGLLPLLFEYLGPSIADFPESQLGVHFYVK